MIVDDELLVRVGLKQNINWNSLGYEVVREASNGKEAFNIIMENVPDLIFLDIKMPEMDGLKLLEELRKNKIHTNVIILSCHDEFEYVRKAMQLGALDYVLKLSLKTSDLSEMLIRLRDKITETIIKKTVSEWEFSYSNNFPLEKIFNEKEDVSEIEEIDKYELKYLIISISAKNNNFSYKDQRRVLFDVLNQVVKNQFYLSIEILDNNIVIMLQIKENKTIEKDGLKNVVYRIKNTMTMCFNSIFQMGISNIDESYKNICELYEQSLIAKSFNFYDSDKAYFYSEGKSTINFEEYICEEELKRIEINLYINNYDDTLEIIKGFFAKIRRDMIVYPESLKSFMVEIINIFTKRIKSGISHEEDIEKTLEKIYSKIFQAEDIESLEKLVIDFVNTCFSYIDNQAKQQYQSEYIYKIKDYVSINYQKEISLHAISGHLNLNESYLSNLFKKETGFNFIDYLNKFRIQKALELLSTTNIKVSDVAEKVGFNNISYFSRLFKKITGVSPKQVKKIKK